MSEACPNENDGATSAALSKAEQAAWEAPALRSTFTADHAREPWAYPCPDWCTGEGEGHDVYTTLNGVRRHEGTSLRVRHDAAYSYVDESESGSVEGVRSANIEVHLEQRSRAADDPTIRMIAHSGRSVPTEEGGTRHQHHQMRMAPMYPDEVRELITVLQHLLKVGGQ